MSVIFLMKQTVKRRTPLLNNITESRSVLVALRKHSFASFRVLRSLSDFWATSFRRLSFVVPALQIVKRSPFTSSLSPFLLHPKGVLCQKEPTRLTKIIEI